MTDLPAPLTPADCDLKDFPHTPIYRSRLRGSSFNAKASDAEWRAGVNLWLNAQDQVPAGSLPDDDTELCRLADLGRDLKTWKRVKLMALHGWFPCSDGRLYNKTVAEVVNMQWRSKIDQRNKTLKARIAMLEKRLELATTAQAKEDITEQIARLKHELSQWQSQSLSQAPKKSVTDEKSASDRSQEKRREVEGKGLDIPLAKANGRHEAAALALGDPPKPSKPAKADPWKEVYDRGKQVLGDGAGGQITKLRKLYADKPHKVLAKINDAAEQREPAKWLAAFLWTTNDGGALSGEYVGGVPP